MEIPAKTNSIRINNTTAYFELGHTLNEWNETYSNDNDCCLWDICADDILTGAVELSEGMIYWYIDGRFYETTKNI